MKLSELLLILVYGVALIFILYFFIGLFYKQQPSTTIIYEDTNPDIIYETPVWNWGVPFNAWPYWTGWYSGGADGGYGYYGRRWGPGYRHGGGHRWGGGHTRPYGGGGRGAMGGAPRGGFGGGARGTMGGGARGGGGGGSGGGGGGRR
jgi:hypothetical protein